MLDLPLTNTKFKAPENLGEFRAMAIDILKNYTHIPDRATLFTNSAGQFNINYRSIEDMELMAADKAKRLLELRQHEAEKLKARLLELETLGL